MVLKTEMDNISIIGGTFGDAGSSNPRYDKYDRFARERVVNKLLPLGKGNTLLDIGCSTGAWYDFFVQRGWGKLVGADISPDRLKLAEKRGYDTVCVRGQSLPFETWAFGTIVCMDVLVHILQEQDRARLFAEVFRVLQPNGIFIFSLTSRKAYVFEQGIYSMLRTLRTWVTGKPAIRGAVGGHCVFLDVEDIRPYLGEFTESNKVEVRGCQFICPSLLARFPLILKILDWLLGSSFLKEYGRVIYVEVRKE